MIILVFNVCRFTTPVVLFFHHHPLTQTSFFPWNFKNIFQSIMYSRSCVHLITISILFSHKCIYSETSLNWFPLGPAFLFSDMWQKYSCDIEPLFYFAFDQRKSQPYQGDFFTQIALGLCFSIYSCMCNVL